MMLNRISKLLVLLLIVSGCNNSEDQKKASESDSMKLVSSIVTTYTSTPSMNFTAYYTYDNERRLISFRSAYSDGSADTETFTYAENKVAYSVKTEQMTLKGEYTMNKEGYTDECTESNIFPNMTVQGKNKFSYQDNKLAIVSSTATVGDKKRTWTELKVDWKDGNITDMSSNWTTDTNNSDHQRKATFTKSYNSTILNNTNLDLNFVIERNIQEKAVLTYDPLIAGACGPKSKNLISDFYHSIEFKPNEEMNYKVSYHFEYEVDDKQLVRKIRVIKPDGSIHATMEIIY